jgi:transposase
MGSGSGKRSSAVAPPTYGDITIYVAQDPVDFRLGINGLSTMVEAMLRFDPFSRNLFCFVNKRRNQIKVLYWQRSGFCPWLKRL